MIEEAIPNVKNIESLLRGVVYKLDHYQREYEWEEEHVVKLVEDLTESFLRDYNPSDELEEVSEYSTYFLGNIILLKNDDGTFIIDGQQRLTSLTLLLLYLRDLQLSENTSEEVAIDDYIVTNVEFTPTFNLDFGDHNAFLKAKFEGRHFEPEEESSSVRNMYDRYNDINNYFSEKLSGETLPFFLYWLINRVYVVEISTNSEHDAYSIFESINDRGLGLGPLDLFKSYLISNIDNKRERKQAAEKWNKITRNLNKFGRGNSAVCIKALLHSKYAKTIGTSKSSKRKQDFEIINNRYHVWFQRFTESKSELKQSDYFIRFIECELDFCAEQFLRIQRASKTTIKELKHVRYVSQLVEPIPYLVLLSPLLPEDSEIDRDEKIDITAKFIEIFLIHKIWNGESIDFRNFQKPLFEILLEIRGFSPIQLNDFFKTYLENEEFKFSGSPVLNRRKTNLGMIRHVLARLTEFVEVGSGREAQYEKYINEKRNSFDVEHIWRSDDETLIKELGKGKFEKLRNNLGGLLLLPSSVNSRLGSLSFEEKLGYYYKENLLARSLHRDCYNRTVKFIRFFQNANLPFEACEKFGVQELARRNNLYCEIAQKIWNSTAFEN